MAFEPGKSGNPSGRPKGAISKRSQLAKLMEPYAKQLIEKVIELALQGDVQALRLCIERIIPKAKQESSGIELPKLINEKNVVLLKRNILESALEGSISVDNAEKLIKLVSEPAFVSKNTLSKKILNDPIEASRIYQSIMGAVR